MTAADYARHLLMLGHSFEVVVDDGDIVPLQKPKVVVMHKHLKTGRYDDQCAGPKCQKCISTDWKRVQVIVV